MFKPKSYFKVKITLKANFLIWYTGFSMIRQVLMCCFVTVFLVACSGINFSEWRFPYMYPVQQGNYINQQQLSQLQLGMTKEQVTFVIGHPVSQFMFNSNQWQYVYQDYKNDKLKDSYILNLNFDATTQKLIQVESAGQVKVK